MRVLTRAVALASFSARRFRRPSRKAPDPVDATPAATPVVVAPRRARPARTNVRGVLLVLATVPLWVATYYLAMPEDPRKRAELLHDATFAVGAAIGVAADERLHRAGWRFNSQVDFVWMECLSSLDDDGRRELVAGLEAQVDEEQVEEAEMAALRIRVLREARAELGAEEQEVVDLLYEHRLTLDDAAVRLGVSRSTLQRRERSALEKPSADIRKAVR